MGGAMHSIWDMLGTWQMFYIIRQLEAGAGCELGGPRENEQWERKRRVEKRIPRGAQQAVRQEGGAGRLRLQEGVATRPETTGFRR